MNQAKALLHSKTFIIAAVQGIIAVIAIFATAYPAVGGLLLAKSILDIVLRVLTTQPIGAITKGGLE